MKSFDHAEFKSGASKQIWQPILSCKILGQKQKYHKIKCDTSLKSYDQAEFKSGAWKQIWQPILSCKILG